LSYTVANVHPRVLLTQADVATLQTFAASGDARYTAFKSYVDAHMPPAADLGNVYPPFGQDYALLYAITGASGYAQAAVAITSGSLHVSDISGDSFYFCRTLMPQLVAVYDWCYDWLVANGWERTYRDGMIAQANAVWPETDGTRTGAWAVNEPENNYYHGFMLTWMYGLCLFYADSAASGWVNHAVSRWQTEALPFLQSQDRTYSASGGVWTEGVSYGYGSTANIFRYLRGHATATGQNLFTSGATNGTTSAWCKESVLSLLYMTAPNRTELLPMGELASDAGNNLNAQHRSALLLAQRYLDPTTAGYAKWALDRATFYGGSANQGLWENFAFRTPEVAAVDYTAALEKGWQAAGANVATSRSDWTTGATQVWLHSGSSSSLGNHQDLAQNGFQIWRDYWVATSQKVAGGGTFARDASQNNSVTIGGNEQYLGSSNATLTYSKETTGWSYFSGEAAPAYQKPANTTWLNGFRRDLIFLKPNFVVVSDRLDAPDASLTKKWHVNSLQTTPPPLTARGYTLTGAVTTSKLFGTVHLPAVPTVTTQGITNGGGSPIAYRIDVAAPTGSSVDYLLNTLETAPAAQGAATTVSGLVTSGTGVHGVQIGTSICAFDMRTGPATSFSYGASGGGTISHVIATGHPSTAYTWSLTPSSASSAPTGTVTTSSQGIANFLTTTTGFASLALTTSGPAPPFYVMQPLGSVVSSAAAASTVHLSGAAFGAATGTVTFGSSGAALSSWTPTDIAATVPTQASYSHTDDVTVSWMTSATVTSGAHFTAASTQYAKATNPAALTPGASQSFSFAGWVYLDSKGAERAIFSKFSTAGGQRSYVLTYDDTADRFRFYGSNGGGTATNAQDTHLGSPATGTWYFIACGFDSPNNQVWISANAAAKDTTSIGTVTNFGGTADFYFSTYNAGTTSPHDGRVDNWGAWFGKVLSASEITTLYNSGGGVQYTALTGTSLSGATAFWQFDGPDASAVWRDQVLSVPVTGGATTAAPTAIGGLVPFTSSSTSTLTYSSFLTTAPAATGPAIGSIRLNGASVNTAPALTQVHILGSGFGSSAGSVLFGVKTATVQNWTDTDVTVLVPAQNSYPISVGVTVSDASSNSDTRNNFVVTAPGSDCSNCPISILF
jgi:hypothetical protein